MKRKTAGMPGWQTRPLYQSRMRLLENDYKLYLEAAGIPWTRCVGDRYVALGLPRTECPCLDCRVVLKKTRKRDRLKGIVPLDFLGRVVLH